MLNNNFGVSIVAEPLSKLAATGSSNLSRIDRSVQELDQLIHSITYVERSGNKLVGFNEKLVYPKYQLPSQFAQLAKLAEFLKERNFKLVAQNLKFNFIPKLSCRILVLLRKNTLQQSLSMLRAAQLSSRCGDAGWSRVNQTGWNEICGDAHSSILTSPVSLTDLRTNIEVVTRRTRALLNVSTAPCLHSLHPSYRNLSHVCKTAASIGLPYITLYYEDLWHRTDEVETTVDCIHASPSQRSLGPWLLHRRQ